MSTGKKARLDAGIDGEAAGIPGTSPGGDEDEDAEEEEQELSPMNLSGGGKSRAQRYLVTVEYMGSRFLGWQKQKGRDDLRTVQGTLEKAFEKFVGQPVTSSGSSRTDTGVHALANVCHVDVERVSKRKPAEVLPPHEPEVVKRAVNHFLQKDGGDLTVVGVRTVSPGFHARFQARERTYHYRILAGEGQPSVFEKDRAWYVSEDLNLAAMQEASQVLVGHHDFSSFRAAGCQAKSPLKTLDELHVCKMPVFPSFPMRWERSNNNNWSRFESHDPKAEAAAPDINKELEVEGGSCSLEANDDNGGRGLEGHDMTNSGGNRSNDADFKAVKPLGKRRLIKPSDFQACSDSEPFIVTPPHCYVITARARSFLYHQVRLLVGTLKAVGSGTLTIEGVKRILAAKSITATPAMAPAHGLFLAEVKYDAEDFNEPEEESTTGIESPPTVM